MYIMKTKTNESVPQKAKAGKMCEQIIYIKICFCVKNKKYAYNKSSTKAKANKEEDMFV